MQVDKLLRQDPFGELEAKTQTVNIDAPTPLTGTNVSRPQQRIA